MITIDFIFISFQNTNEKYNLNGKSIPPYLINDCRSIFFPNFFLENHP